MIFVVLWFSCDGISDVETCCRPCPEIETCPTTLGTSQLVAAVGSCSSWIRTFRTGGGTVREDPTQCHEGAAADSPETRGAGTMSKQTKKTSERGEKEPTAVVTGEETDGGVSATTLVEILRDQQRLMKDQQESQRQILMEIIEQQRAEMAKHRDQMTDILAPTLLPPPTLLLARNLLGGSQILQVLRGMSEEPASATCSC